jgi:hypothetical protein
MQAFQCRIAASPNQVAILEHLDATGQIVADHVHKMDGHIVLVLSEAEIELAKAAGLELKIGAPLVTRAEHPEPGAALDLTTGFVSGYMDALEVDAAITAIAAAHPAFCSVITLPHPTPGYDGSHGPALGAATVRALRITANPALRNRPGFLLICGTHAREWINPPLALEFAQQLLNNIDPASTEPETVEATRIVMEGDVIIVPVLNPDGLNFSIHDQALWRKTRNPNSGSPACPGTDANRNFEVFFGGAGSSPSPCSDTYRGAFAFSTPETRNVRWLLEEFPNMLVGVDSHSFGNAVFRPQPGGGAHVSALPVSAADEAHLAALETTFVNAVAGVNGTTYSTGTTSNHAGTSDEYMFFAHRVFAFDTECGTGFQPPWSQAATVIQEVATGFRALAHATLDLSPTTPAPLTTVQAIDRTGSMVSFGYDGAARRNAGRFVDLMSLGDTTGVVTFSDPSPDPAATPPADRAQVVTPLTLLDDPGDAAMVRASIDAITFGGWTPIGAGLQKSSDLLSGAGGPRAILLLSDGFENRDPQAAAVLSGWPANLPVYTIALGPAADTGLLENIATQTGGQFQMSPDALDLHLIYNQMRADMADTDTIINTMVDSARLDRDESGHEIQVEYGLDRIEITLSAEAAPPREIVLLTPSGRIVDPGDFGVTWLRRKSYVVIGIDRPAPGTWTLRTAGASGPFILAVFARGPLKSEVWLERDKNGCLVPRACVSFDGHKIDDPDLRVASRRIDLAGERSWLGSKPKRDWQDRSAFALPKHVAELPGASPALHWSGVPPVLPRGLYRLNIALQGSIPGGVRFRRNVVRTARLA